MKRATKPRTKVEPARAAAPLPGSWLHEPFLERAADPALADSGQHALGAFLTLRLIDRFAVGATETPAQALAYQTQATRDYLLDLHPQTPEAGHLLEIVRVADAVRAGSNRRLLWSPLLAYAFWLEEALRLAEALDVVDTAMRMNDGKAANEELAGNLQRGRVLRLLCRFEEAREAYGLARSRAIGIGDTHSALLSRVGDAIVVRQLGNLPASEQALGEILKDAEELGDLDAQARAHHDLGVALDSRGLCRVAVQHFYRAFELYERPAHKLRALSDVGEALKRDGRCQVARDAFTVVVKSAATEDIRVGTMISLLEVSALLGDRLGFARWQQEITQISDRLPPERRADFYLQLGVGHAAFGQPKKAERCLREALVVAEQHHLNEYVFRAEAALEALQSKSAPGGRQRPTPQGADTEEFSEIAEKLHALEAG